MEEISSFQLLSRVWLFVSPWTAARQASLSITNSGVYSNSESVMPSNHLILCHPLLLPASIFPSIRVFSNESVLHIRWPKYWNFSFSIVCTWSSLHQRHEWLIEVQVTSFFQLCCLVFCAQALCLAPATRVSQACGQPCLGALTVGERGAARFSVLRMATVDSCAGLMGEVPPQGCLHWGRPA